MNCTASSAAAGLTTSSEEPSRNTIACSAASSKGWTPSSSGIVGKTAEPAGTSSGDCWESAMVLSDGAYAARHRACAKRIPLAPRHRRNDAHLVAVLDRRVQAVEIADVLIVEIDVHEPAD